VKFGLCYIADHHPEVQGDYREWYEGMIDEIKLADRLGYEAAFVAEHHFPHFAFGSPAVFLAAVARETERIRLGTSVGLLTLNDPVRMAEDYAQVDVLSGGRLDFGVGRGVYKYDYDTMRVDMATSRDRFEENLRFVDTAWSNEVFSFEGQWTTVTDHAVHPRPVQRPRPPIWMAATVSKESFEKAGANGYNLMTVPFFYADPSDLQERLSIYKSALLAAGNDPADREVCGA
jgi:alkanesulfonate monooxygenase SsuD/methylene tetrahydromethanopterin reductase-like flavin-dependent oxidoreductase (luciferase family)